LNPVWTEDAKGLIYPYRGLQDTAERLVEQDLASGKVVQLTTGEAADEDAAPALSPDGLSVAVLRRHVAYTDVMTVDLGARTERVFYTEPNATTSGLTWVPDGGGVVIGSVRRGGYTLLYIPLHGQPKVLDVKHPIPLNPVFANDGKTLMFLAANRTRKAGDCALVGSDSEKRQSESNGWMPRGCAKCRAAKAWVVKMAVTRRRAGRMDSLG
jgi:Tol biopolymer transport system component